MGGQATIFHSGMTFDGITAEWRVPTVECETTPGAESSEWLGVDGFDSTDPQLFQSGIQQDCLRGHLQNDFAWWTSDRLGCAPQPLFDVDSGDAVRAEVERAGSNLWDYFIEDLASGREAEGSERYDGPGDSVEWIVESPGSSELADFQSVVFSRLGLLDSYGSWSDPPLSAEQNISVGGDFFETAISAFRGLGAAATFTVDYSG